jgi:uncharacterized protein (TIGR02598 family)
MNLPNSKNARNPQGGFTILEVGVAAAVLAFTLVGMIGTIESGAKMMDVSRNQTIAAQILRSEIDGLRTQSWNTVSGYSYSSTSVTSSIDAAFNAGTQGFSAVRKVNQVGGNSTLLQITFTVSWKGITGLNYSRSSTTYVGQNGLSLAYQRT